MINVGAAIRSSSSRVRPDAFERAACAAAPLRCHQCNSSIRPDLGRERVKESRDDRGHCLFVPCPGLDRVRSLERRRGVGRDGARRHEEQIDEPIRVAHGELLGDYATHGAADERDSGKPLFVEPT